MRLRVFLFVAFTLGACGDDGAPVGNADAGAAIDASSPFDAARVQDAAPPFDCVSNPRTHLEIINACTEAEKLTKNPVLPLLGADGKLPPLP